MDMSTPEQEVKTDASQEEGGQGQEGDHTGAQIRRGRRTQERLAKLLSPWWEREPARLQADIDVVTRAGFRVSQGIDALHRLVLDLERDGERYQFRYQNDAELIGFALAADGSGRRTHYLSGFGRSRLRLLDELSQGLGHAIGRQVGEAVLLPFAWQTLGSGDHGTLTLGRAAIGDALVPLEITGASEAAVLALASAPFARAFPRAIAGLWSRGRWTRAAMSDPELLVALVEAQLAEAHQITPDQVRERLKREIGAVVERGGALSQQGQWTFVRRGQRGAAIVLRPQVRYSGGSNNRAPYAHQLAGQRVAIIGCGAVGWTVALLLARSGVDHFSLFDDDQVHAHNLARLGGFMGSEGAFKVDALAQQLEAVAPGISADVHVIEIGRRVGAQAIVDAKPDLIINVTAEEISTDETNVASLFLRRPALYAWVSNGVLGARIFRVRPLAGPCYECVRQSAPAPIRSRGLVPVGQETPWEGSVLDVDLFAATVAKAAVLELIGVTDPTRNPEHLVLRFDGLVPTARLVTIQRDRSCSVCRP